MRTVSIDQIAFFKRHPFSDPLERGIAQSLCFTSQWATCVVMIEIVARSFLTQHEGIQRGGRQRSL